MHFAYLVTPHRPANPKGKGCQYRMSVQDDGQLGLKYVISHLNTLLILTLTVCWVSVSLCAMQHCHLWITVKLRSLFIPHHVAACVRPDAAAWTRLSSGGNSSQQTARPVASPAQWSPGSSLDL